MRATWAGRKSEGCSVALMNDSGSLTVASVCDMVDEVGEAEVRAILQEFTCPLNEGVQNYVRRNAVSFALQGVAPAFLVGQAPASPDETFRLDGFFALAAKVLTLDHVSRLSGTLTKRLARFGTRDERRDTLTLAMPLVAQLGRNYAREAGMSGHELLELACQRVVQAQRVLGGRMVFVEVEDNAKLLEFYSSSSFVEVGRRERHNRPELIRMIRNLGPLHRAGR